jgi:hypothetical protein
VHQGEEEHDMKVKSKVKAGPRDCGGGGVVTGGGRLPVGGAQIP